MKVWVVYWIDASNESIIEKVLGTVEKANAYVTKKEADCKYPYYYADEFEVE